MGLKKIGLLAKKAGMTMLFDNEGVSHAVTVLEIPANYITQVKTTKSDGYNAVQIGIEPAKEKRLTKPMIGHFKKHNVPLLRILHEFRLEEEPKYITGQNVELALFKDIKYVDVIGFTKGRGFTGMVKRWNKVMGPKTHGSMNVRQIGSVGSNTYPGRIRRGKKMPGHYGNEKVTVKNLKVFDIDQQNNLILVKGAVPGPKGRVLIVKPSIKNFVSKKVAPVAAAKK